jgi:hypothetical protein
LCPVGDASAVGIETVMMVEQDLMIYMLGDSAKWTQSPYMYPRLADPSGGGFDRDR